MLGKIIRKTIPFVLLALWLQGCSLTPLSATGQPYDAGRESARGPYWATVPPLTPELNDFFETAAPGGVTRAAPSPWGEEVEIAVAAFYDAASGRQCRELAITEAVSGSSPGLVCRIRPGQWEPVRPIASSRR
jgi:hypothetical protein